MATVNSAGFYAQLSAKNKAIGGLASGLDTDSLVEALTLATRTKLATQTQKKTLLGWKMTAYRGVASTLRAFQTKHISMAAGTSSLKAQAFFNTFKGTASSDKITVNPGTGATPGSFTVDSIKQLATNQTFTTAKFEKDLQGESFELTADSDFIGKTLQLQMGNTAKTIKLDTLQGKTGNAFETELQRLVDASFGTKSQPRMVEITDPMDPHFGEFVQEKDADGKLLYDQVSTVKVEFQREGGSSTKGVIKLDGGTSVVTVKNNADLLGLESGASNRISLNDKISDLFPGMEGDTFKFAINDVVITAKASESINTVINRVNNSTAGVRVNFDSATQAFVFTSKVTGAGDNLRMRDVEGNFLHQFIGAQSGNAFTSIPGFTDASQKGGDLSAAIGALSDEELKDYKFDLKMGNSSLTLSLDISAYHEEMTTGVPPLSREDAIIKSLNAQVEKAFGTETGISFRLDGTGEIVLDSAKNDKQITFSQTTGSGVKDAFALLDLDYASNTAFTMGYLESATGSTLGSGNDLNTLLNSMVYDTYTMDLTIGGQTKTLSVKVTQAELDALKPNAADPKYAEKLEKNQRDFIAKKLNAAKAEAFGSSAHASAVSFSVGADNKITVKASRDNVKFSVETDPDADHDLVAAFKLGNGVDPLSNAAPGQGTSLKSVANISTGDTVSFWLGDVTDPANEVTVTLDEDMTIQDFINEVNEQVGRDIMTFQNGKVVLSGGTQSIRFDETAGGGSNVMESLFGRGSYVTESAKPGFEDALAKGAGQNAELIVGGEILVSASNTFTINGCDFTVNAASEAGDKPITVTVSSDPDDVVDKIKGFIEEYNALVDMLDGLVRETKVAGYEPLTDEQRAGMSEDQIKQWESEAKKGLLYGDSTIRGIMQQMRTALYSRVEAAGISLYDIGITTESMTTAGSNYKGNGRLEMSEAGEAKLRAMLETNPDSVRELFTNSEKGLAVQLDNIINDATRTSSTNQGSLVRMAGTEALTGNNSSTLSRQIDNIDKQIETLKTRLENEYNRYWQKFAALETAISRMNSQSSWLADFGS